jgi:hypothetical protein
MMFGISLISLFGYHIYLRIKLLQKVGYRCFYTVKYFFNFPSSMFDVFRQSNIPSSMFDVFRQSNICAWNSYTCKVWSELKLKENIWSYVVPLAHIILVSLQFRISKVCILKMMISLYKKKSSFLKNFETKVPANLSLSNSVTI